MNDFENQLISLLTDIKNELSSIHKKIDDALNANNETSSELINNLFGFLNQDPKSPD